MPRYEEEKRKNLDAYQSLKDEIRAHQLGHYVARADVRLVKVSRSFKGADEAVKS